jgi:hypothetical protein
MAQGLEHSLLIIADGGNDALTRYDDVRFIHYL